jgi:hypothetical protein
LGAVDEALEQSDVNRALDILRATKRMHVSPYTGAIGGKWVWSDNDFASYDTLEQARPELANHHPGLLEPFDTYSFSQSKKEAMQLVLEKLAECPRTSILGRFETRKLMALMRREDWAEIRQDVFDALTLLTEILQGQDSHEDDISRATEKLRYALQNEQTLLTRYKLGSKFAVGTGAMVGGAALGVLPTCLGFMISGQVGLLISGASSMALGLGAMPLGTQLGKWSYQLTNPTGHKALVKLEEIERKKRGN